MHQGMLRALPVLLFVCTQLPAQEFRATIAGHVYDSSGASVAGAQIQAIAGDTNQVTTATDRKSVV